MAMKFWTEHTALRSLLMIVFFVAGLAMIMWGYGFTGQIKGLFAMLAGLALLLADLWLYNIVFTDPKGPKRRKEV